MKKLYVLLVVVTGLISCKTHYRISVQEPALVKLSDSVINVAVINNITNENSPEKVIEQVVGATNLNGNVLASERAVDGLRRAIDNSNYMKSTTIATQAVRNEGGEINWGIIDSICDANQLDAVIEMVEIRSISPVGGTVLANATGQGSSRLEGWLYVNIYEAHSHFAVERFSIRRYYNIPISGSTNIIAILSDVARKREYYRALGWELGYGAGQLIYPKWVWVDRTYFNKGSSSIKRAKPMLREGNWDLARRTLEPDAEYYKEKTRGRVLYNLALAYEGMGMVDTAIEYAEKSAIAGNKLANEYLVKLRRRKQMIDNL